MDRGLILEKVLELRAVSKSALAVELGTDDIEQLERDLYALAAEGKIVAKARWLGRPAIVWYHPEEKRHPNTVKAERNGPRPKRKRKKRERRSVAPAEPLTKLTKPDLKILKELEWRSFPALTAELEEPVDMGRDAVLRRLKRLAATELVIMGTEDTGQRGRPSYTWQITEFGRRAVTRAKEKRS